MVGNKLHRLRLRLDNKKDKSFDEFQFRASKLMSVLLNNIIFYKNVMNSIYKLY